MKHPVLLQSGFFSNQKFAKPAATLAFFRMPKAQQAAQFKFAASSNANQQLLRQAVVKTGGFTKIFIKPATVAVPKPTIVFKPPPKSPLAPKAGIAPAPKTQLMLASSAAQPGITSGKFPLLLALAAFAFFFLKR